MRCAWWLIAFVATGCGSSGADRGGGAGAGSSGFGGASGELGPGTVVSPKSACATASSGASSVGVDLVFMFDRSASMNESSKWTSCKAGLEAFFADPSSKGLSASMAFFSQPDVCNVAAYAAPAASMRLLPDATSFSARLDAITPAGDTPTLPALQGAIQYAKEVQASAKPGEKVVIVLVTDGDPNGCGSTPDNVAAAAAAVASTIPTYVIGVGPDAVKLDTIAKGGGTGSAIMIATSAPSQITSDLEKALGSIKAASLSCNYDLPLPPAGQTLDVAAVNVNYTPGGGGALTTLPYSASCAAANGWHYDDPASPKQIVMCPSICATLEHDTSGGSVDIVFGCATVGDKPR
jgi:hypothetical protein